MNKQTFLPLLFSCAATAAFGQDIAEDSLYTELQEISIGAPGGVRKLNGVTNTSVISVGELRRAACCNLGESFTTNPSVDVSYSDAATGARQIRLLGLSGAYVQMLTENVPNFRGVAMPYGLGYVAGPWMQSIQVSKGASSVKNGYESITGQINIEMKKPQLDPSLAVNMYYDSKNKLEANFDGNLHLGKNWSGGILAHFENSFSEHDGNDDGFMDMPKIRQVSAMNRWAYMGRDYVFQAAVKFLDEQRRSGQSSHHMHPTADKPLYKIGIDTRRWEFFTKNAYIFDHENDGNVALIFSGSYHDQDATYGYRLCDIAQGELYASLMFEKKWLDLHSISTGASFHYDNYHYRYRFVPDVMLNPNKQVNAEAISGLYAQYTLNLNERFIAMGGVRYDYNSVYGSVFTPRMHLRWNPSAALSMHASAGRGFRSPQPLAEFSYLMASSRKIDIADRLDMESAWNFGAGATATFYPAEKKLSLTGEYYYTDFQHQLMVDLDSDPHAAKIFTSANRSFSHALQFEATFDPIKDLSLSAAWRLTDVKVDYGQGLVQKPLTSRQKALFSVGYTPMMGLWSFDVTCVVNGSGRMPTPYTLSDGSPSWNSRYKAYAQLNAQITRNFRHWAVYIGGENLTGYRQPHPIIDGDNPWGGNFDSTMIYGPLDGAMVYVGFRYNFTKFL